jgi:multidrug efflux pump subunit AcrB
MGDLSTRLIGAFIASKTTPLLVVILTAIGLLSISGLAREEEPQINVTLIDLQVDLPATPVHEIQQRVCRPLESILNELPGVEYVYSTSLENQCRVSLRFYVGYSPVKAITETKAQLDKRRDRLPDGASSPLIQVRNIDDVPVLVLTLWSERYDSYQLRRLGVQLCEALKGARDVGSARVIGGQRRAISVYPERAQLAAHEVMLSDIVHSLEQGNYPVSAGRFRGADREVLIDGVATYRSAEDVRNAQIKNYDGTIIASLKPPLRLGDIARVEDGPGEPNQHVHFSPGAGGREAASSDAQPLPGFRDAVSIALAKLPGSSAVAVVERVLARVEAERGRIIPADVRVEITRDYGHTATSKSDELLLHMAISLSSVTLLIWFFLGWRESLVVAVAIPVALALTLSGFYFLDYTLNRVTLFALIFSIGILVDDPIVDIENIARHLRLPGNRGRAIAKVVVEAVYEVRRPLILATLAVILAILPMSFVSGLMGPYMRPIPVGATIAMLASMLVAFVVTPWAAARWLKAADPGDAASADASADLRADGPADHPDGRGEGWTTRLYRRSMQAILRSRASRWTFWAGSILLLLGAVALFPAGLVQVKMLPFDDKNEFQVIIDMPEGTTLARTDAAAREIARAIARFSEVQNVQVYSGAAAPFNFNGLIRGYYQRGGPDRADIQVNLIDRHRRDEQSHGIAKRIRGAILPIAGRHAARLTVAEIPPGPPVRQTLVAEVYGPEEAGRIALVKQIEQVFRGADGVVDIDNCLLHEQRKQRFEVNPRKSAGNHIDPEMCSINLAIALNGRRAGVLHTPREREQVDIGVRLRESERSSVESLLSLPIRGRDLRMVPLGDMMTVSDGVIDQPLRHKGLMPVAYVQADVAGAMESPAFAVQQTWDAIAGLTPNAGPNPAPDIYFTAQPPDDHRYAIKWDGELHITYEVFRDLGIALAVALGLIYLLMVWWFNSYRTPLIIMAVIPGSLIGILPAHTLMGSFFSATSMIGFIAGAGIVVRNSIILVDFIQLRVSQGMALREAVIDAGAVRFRPMLLTALAVVAGTSVILLDPIFQGMALSLMAGEIASLVISRAAVPVIYYMVYGRDASG